MLRLTEIVEPYNQGEANLTKECNLATMYWNRSYSTMGKPIALVTRGSLIPLLYGEPMLPPALPNPPPCGAPLKTLVFPGICQMPGRCLAGLHLTISEALLQLQSDETIPKKF